MGRVLLAGGVLLSLLLALLGGFYLGSSPPAEFTLEPESTPVEDAADPSGELGLRVTELEAIVLRADRENATLKRRVAAAEAGQARAEQAMASLEAELADSRTRHERTLDDLDRLRRELAQRNEPPPAPRPAPPAPASPPPVLVRLLSLDPATQVVAIDRGADEGIRIGDRHRLEDTAGASALIEWTEVRPTFAVGRRIPIDQPGATVLELVSGRQYALIPPP